MLNGLAFTALPVQSRLACDRRADRRPASQADRWPGQNTHLYQAWKDKHKQRLLPLSRLERHRSSSVSSSSVQAVSSSLPGRRRSFGRRWCRSS